MTNEYTFDKTYLKSLLDRCYKALENNNLSRQKRKSIQSDIIFFKNALQDKYEINMECSKKNNKKSFDELKAEFIIYLKYVYQHLGDNGIKFLLNLDNSGIFGDYIDCNYPDVSDDIIVRTTLKTYENRVPFLFPKAKNMLSLKPVSHILLTRDPEIDSFCHLCAIVDESFVIANTGECSSILVHEVEHGVEDRFHLVNDMEEAGPMFLEMGYEDELFKLEGIKDYSSIVERIEDNGDYLSYLSEFLRLIQALAIKNFSVSSIEFKKIFVDNVKLLNDDVEGFLREENPAEEINLYFDYLFSFLNAIELYTKTNGLEVTEKTMMSYLKRKLWPMPNDSQAFKMYEDYIEKIRRKL